MLKMANSGPFKVVPAIGFVGGKKLKTLPELNRLCDKLLLQPVKPVPSVLAMECASDAYLHHHWFAQFAVVSVCRRRRITAARFRVQQNRRNGRRTCPRAFPFRRSGMFRWKKRQPLFPHRPGSDCWSPVSR